MDAEAVPVEMTFSTIQLTDKPESGVGKNDIEPAARETPAVPAYKKVLGGLKKVLGGLGFCICGICHCICDSDVGFPVCVSLLYASLWLSGVYWVPALWQSMQCITVLSISGLLLCCLNHPVAGVLTLFLGVFAAGQHVVSNATSDWKENTVAANVSQIPSFPDSPAFIIRDAVVDFNQSFYGKHGVGHSEGWDTSLVFVSPVFAQGCTGSKESCFQFALVKPFEFDSVVSVDSVVPPADPYKSVICEVTCAYRHDPVFQHELDDEGSFVSQALREACTQMVSSIAPGSADIFKKCTTQYLFPGSAERFAHSKPWAVGLHIAAIVIWLLGYPFFLAQATD